MHAPVRQGPTLSPTSVAREGIRWFFGAFALQESEPTMPPQGCCPFEPGHGHDLPIEES